MPATTRIDLHLHSSYSDGRLSPKALAELVAQHGLALAALADHDTLASQKAFHAALALRGIGRISAVELTTWHGAQEIHLLAYGVNVDHPELLDTVAALGQARNLGFHSVTSSLQHRPPNGTAALPLVGGRLLTGDAIALVHRAGGKAFLAHPLTDDHGIGEARGTVAELKRLGLDGLEALYSRYREPDQRALVELAAEHGLLVSAGSDFHGTGQDDAALGIDMPAELWNRLQGALADTVRGGELSIPRPSRHSLKRFVSRIVLPAVLAVLLFVVTIFAFILPRFEAALLDRKREMIRELSNSAVTILAESHRAELRGELTRPQAQVQAASRIATLRYGPESKDYFWLQDLSPRIVMHPYRPELNGQDVSSFRDARGVRIFVEFADVVRRRDEGYVDYVWQWNDNPSRLTPKESYVRGFQPWGWVIGTGLYTEDVRQEIKRLERGMAYGSAGIVVIVALLLLYLVRESLHLERQRSEAEGHLMETTHRYQSLVEASSEGAILLVDGRCKYANPVVLKLLGRSPNQVQLLHLDDILPAVAKNATAREQIAGGVEQPTGPIEVELHSAGGGVVPCVITLTPIQLGERRAIILQVRQETTRSRPPAVLVPGFPELVSGIAAANHADEIIALCRGVGAVVSSSIVVGMHARQVTRQLSAVCDAATGRLIELAIAELPPPPCPFCFVGMGSQGREEQTLFTDQDNAIVFSDEADPDCARPWFAALGRLVSTHLDAAGYSFCRGDVMAQNPRWCNPLSTWQQLFREWIAKAEPKELLDLSIFFDLRPVYGEASLVNQLKADTASALATSPGFFPHFAQNALLFKPPIRLFGRIIVGTATGERAGLLDLKDATMPIVSFARLYALKHSIMLTNTFDRIDAMVDAGVLAHSTRDDLAFVHEHLLRVRIEHQAAQLAEGLPPDNVVDHHSLNHMQMVLLREAFGQVDIVQQKITTDFLGGQK
ncbi:MAG: DUF294 nucleotidyltransferase-like domain-containing protein [Thermoanaerobaculaceae bacterium]|jgi:predicted metal-dependent phosphoesterase TrpH|nr:DUF294 nucleotidyltransferase-like domain-containing protein [Thermoanaerobaculaceae bacterium]